MNVHQLFPDREHHDMPPADPHTRIRELEAALREIQQMSIRRQIADLDTMLDGVKSLSPASFYSDAVWLESLHEFCERALRGGTDA